MKKIIPLLLAVLALLPVMAMEPYNAKESCPTASEKTVTIIVKDQGEVTSIETWVVNPSSQRRKSLMKRSDARKISEQALKEALKALKQPLFKTHTDETFDEALLHPTRNAMINGMS